MSLTLDGARITFGGNGVRQPELLANPTAGADVTVNHNTIINPTADRIGIGTTYWEDASSRRAAGARSMADALNMAGMRFVRYPGGHEADGVTFFLNSVGAEVSTPTPRLCRFGSGEWPATDTTYWSANSTGGTWTRDIYQLQDFLDDCVAIGAEPIIVVALDTVVNPPTGVGAWTPTKAQIIVNAAAMVRWCNVTNNYNVKYWEIANESWSTGPAYTHGYPTAAAYGADFDDIVAAMKAEDPTIYVGMNWNTQQGYEDALAAAGPANVDWLAAHRYPFFDMTYAEYQAVGIPNLISEANRATNAINTLAEPHKSRIFVMMTEAGYNSMPNDMGAAVIIAHVLGGNLATSNIVAVILWTTRYPPYGTSHDQFDQNNNLTIAGWGARLTKLLVPGAMVSVTSSVTNVFAYASYQNSQGRYAVLLINRGNSEQTVTVRAAGATSGELWKLAGSGPTDTNPTLTRTGVTPTSSTVTVTLPVASVSTLILSRF